MIDFNNTKIIIPARSGSKGLPGKNKLLLHYTIMSIPKILLDNVIVTTDDNFIKTELKKNYSEVLIHNRSNQSASDTASTKVCIEEVIKDFCLNKDLNIIMLYLTYPKRTWEDITNSYKFFQDKNAKSLLCKVLIKDHPYLCMQNLPGDKGKQVVKHNLCRRQDYPEYFRISHMVSIFKVSEIKKLGSNLYNKDTHYFQVTEPLDVDTLKDFKEINKNEKY